MFKGISQDHGLGFGELPGSSIKESRPLATQQNPEHPADAGGINREHAILAVMDELKIDLGCGAIKREGFIGLDSVMSPGVDHVLDLTRDRYPFEDNTVDHVFSSHFFEHIPSPDHAIHEIARICRDGAKIEIWTPYAFSNDAFIYGHVAFLTEEPWIHFCCLYPDVHLSLLCGRWLLKNINYVVLPEVEKELVDRGFKIDFAIRYFKSVVKEFGVEIEFRSDLNVAPITPIKTYSHSRYGERSVLTAEDGATNAALQG